MTELAHVTTDSFEPEVLQSTLPVLVDFYGDHCAPCKALEPALSDIAREYSGEVRVVKVDVYAEPDLADRFVVAGIPTLLLFRDGEVTQRFTGAITRSRIAAAIEGSTAGQA